MALKLTITKSELSIQIPPTYAQMGYKPTFVSNLVKIDAIKSNLVLDVHHIRVISSTTENASDHTV